MEFVDIRCVGQRTLTLSLPYIVAWDEFWTFVAVCRLIPRYAGLYLNSTMFHLSEIPIKCICTWYTRVAKKKYYASSWKACYFSWISSFNFTFSWFILRRNKYAKTYFTFTNLNGLKSANCCLKSLIVYNWLLWSHCKKTSNYQKNRIQYETVEKALVVVKSI